MMNPRLLGILGGLLAGGLLILAGWRVLLILLVFGTAGCLIGGYLESRKDPVLRLREFFRRIFRS